jgi:hypothetical protein
VVSLPGHSEGVLQLTQAPFPSQNMLPLHWVSTAAFWTPQAPDTQVLVWHSVSVPHSEAVLHPTQVPFPSQNMLLLVPQVVSVAAFWVPQVPEMQVLVWQAVSAPGHSDAVLHPTQVPCPSQNMLPPAPQVELIAAFWVPHVPETHVLVWQAVS